MKYTISLSFLILEQPFTKIWFWLPLVHWHYPLLGMEVARNPVGQTWRMATFHCWRLEQLWSWNFSFCNGKTVSKANTTSQAISLTQYFPFLDHLTTDSENAQSNTFKLIVRLTLVVRGIGNEPRRTDEKRISKKEGQREEIPKSSTGRCQLYMHS